MSKYRRGREAVLVIARKGGRVLWKCLRAAHAAWTVVNLVGNEDAASLADTVLTAFVDVWKILIALVG